jgi:hypothetical protein
VDANERIRKLLALGDNRLKQGLPSKARETFEEALVLAREAGLEDTAGRLVTGRIEDLDRVEAGAKKTPPSG